MLRLMGDLLRLIWGFVIGLFRSRASLETEILTLRHQLNVLRRKAPKRLAFSNFDRFVFASLYRITSDVLNALVIVKPETVIRWHRAGFRLFWRWKSRTRGGRPKGIMTLFTAQFSPGGSGPWAFVTGPLPLAHPGRMACGTADWLAPAGMS